jgi:AcrR family transcriptional regulator
VTARSKVEKRAGSVRRAKDALGARPVRGDPSETRQRIVLAAAQQFEAHGFYGCDTNAIARAAGYAPGTFYKHFADKREVFLAVYKDWVRAEWEQITTLLAHHRSAKTAPSVVAGLLADAVLAHHCNWPGFRASLRALVAVDPVVRAEHRRSRKRQLALLQRATGSDRAGAIFLLLTTERVADALADGELEALGLSPARVRAFLAEKLLEQLNSPRGRTPAAVRSGT